jgi:hypothetical protein
MNVYELTTQTLTNCKFSDTTDATTRSDNEKAFITSFNTAYRRICREKLHLWYTEEVTLDAAKCFVMSSLSKKAIKILKISQYQDYSEDAGYIESPPYPWDKYDGAGTIVVPAATASTAVFVEYEYMPTMLGITYNISGANTAKVIPVDEAISAAEATALAGQTLHVIDVSTGLYYDYTIVSSASGVAGACTITVDETISVAVADGDEIFIGDNWEPAIDEEWHMILTYWAASQYYLSLKSVNYATKAAQWKSIYDEALAGVDGGTGEDEALTGAYSPQI